MTPLGHISWCLLHITLGLLARMAGWFPYFIMLSCLLRLHTFASLLGSCTLETCFPSCFWLRIDWCPILAWRAWNQITWLMVDLFIIDFLMFAEIWRLMRMYEAWLSWQRFFLLIAAMVLEMAKLVQLKDFWREWLPMFFFGGYGREMWSDFCRVADVILKVRGYTTDFDLKFFCFR